MTGALDSLIVALESEFARDARGPRAARLLAEYAASHDDWRRFAFFDSETYTRNLVARRDPFELLVLAWNAGQASPIHNHAGQQCWMAVLEGVIEEHQYDPPDSTLPLALRVGRSSRWSRGMVAYIDDEIALHRVQPRPGDRGVSLHLYARPIDACNVYDESSGRVLRRTLAYYSIDARPLVAATPPRA